MNSQADLKENVDPNMKRTGNNNHTEPNVGNSNVQISRRDFFSVAWKGLGILASFEIIGTVTAYFFSGKSRHTAPPKQLMEAGPVTAFALNTVTPFASGRFFLARQADGGFIAISIRCTHLGCSISWEKTRQRFICPCHSSAFDSRGDVINPPAPRALDYYPVLVENGLVKVDIGTIKERNSFKRDQLTYA
jgi:cytochrome b6-f complex iron-sulfur subunit